MTKRQWFPGADLVIKNVKIYTVDLTIDEIKSGKNDFTVFPNGYVAAKDGRTIAVGAGEPARELIDASTEIIDGEGKTLIPGMIDCHMHGIWKGLELAHVNHKTCQTKADFVSRLRERAGATPKGVWVRGCEWNELKWDDTSPPTKEDLDEASTEHPVMSSRFCHHVYVANSKAMELAGITRDTPDPPGGQIGRDEHGEPNGLFYENSAMGLIDAVIPLPTEEELVTAIENLGGVVNSVGLTSCIDANLTFPQMRAYLQALKQDRLTFRGNIMFYLDKAWGDISYHLNRIQEMPCVTGFGNEMVKMNGIKVTYDGNTSAGTSLMRKPYEHMPETSGYSTITKEELTEVCRLGAELNWQVGIHCTGDLAADEAIEAIAEAYKVKQNDARHYIIHLCEFAYDQVPLLAKHNIGIASQPGIAWLCGEQLIIGKELSERYMPAGTLLRGGVVVGGSSDCPVIDCNPFFGFYGAITREAIDGTVYNPDDRITAKDALIMWTKSSAYFSHDDDKMGSVEVGNLADYALLDRDVLEVPTKDIVDTKVLMTILGGKVVYEA